MEKVLFPLFILCLAGVVGGCAGRGYGGAAYGGSYTTYHASAPLYYYGYLYPNYYYPDIRSIHQPTVIIRPPLRPERRMIIDRRYADRYLRDDHRHFQHDHRWDRGRERFVHPRYGKERLVPDRDTPSERRFSRDPDLHPRDRQLHRFERGPGFRPGEPRCTGVRC